MTLLPVCLFILSFIKSGILYILYFVSCYQVILWLKLFQAWPLETPSHWPLCPSVPLPLMLSTHFLHCTVFQGLSCIFSAPALGSYVSPRSSGVGVPVATEVVLFLIQKKNEVVKGFITFVVQILLDLKSISVWYLAFTGLHHCLPVYSFLSSGVVY